MTQWRVIPSFPNYEASDEGGIRSVGYRDARGGWQMPILRKQTVTPAGRMQVGLTREGRQHSKLVHRLILEAFRGPCPEGREACHWDDDPSNNRLDNLRWGTPSDNRGDQIRNGKNANRNKTHCPRNHRLVEPNLVPSALKRGQRTCLACQRVLASRKSGFDPETADRNYVRIMKGVHLD